MKDIKSMSLSELKTLKDLLENRVSELRLHQVDGEYYPLYTDKEINKINMLETQAIKSLASVNKVIREKLDDFIGSTDFS